MEMEYKISHIRGCFEINSDFYFCTFLHIILHIFLASAVMLMLHVQFKLKSRSCFMCEVTIPNL